MADAAMSHDSQTQDGEDDANGVPQQSDSSMADGQHMASSTEACLTLQQHGNMPDPEQDSQEHEHAHNTTLETDLSIDAARSTSQQDSTASIGTDTAQPSGSSMNDDDQGAADSQPQRPSEHTGEPCTAAVASPETGPPGQVSATYSGTPVDLERTSSDTALQAQAHHDPHRDTAEPDSNSTEAGLRASADGNLSADQMPGGGASSITLAAGLTIQSTDPLESEATAATALLLDSWQRSTFSDAQLAGQSMSELSMAGESEALLGSRPPSVEAGASTHHHPVVTPQAATAPPAKPAARAAADGTRTRHPPPPRAPACTSPRPVAVVPTVIPQAPSTSDSRPSTALLVRPALITRAASPSQHPANRRGGGLLFSPSDSPPLTPPDSPSNRRSPPGAGRNKSVAGPGGSSHGQRSPSRGPPVGRQSLRALPPSAYKRRRTPVDELLANFNLTKYVGNMAKEKHDKHSREQPAPPDPQLRDLELAAERLQREGNTLQPRLNLQESPGRASGQATRRPGSGRGGNAGAGVVQGSLGADEDSSVGLGQIWVDGELLGSPPEWASDLSSRPESARRTGRLLHQDSGDGRHQGMTGLSPYQGLATHMQGAYLTYPEYSFGGCRPLKASPERGVPFERYGHKDEPTSAVQQFYLRPDRSVLIGMQQMVEKQQQQQQLLQQQQQMALGGPNPGGGRSELRHSSPPRLLPNGVPVSRLEQLREVHEQGRQKTLPPSRKAKGPRQSSGGGPKEQDLTPNQSLRAESSTVLTVQDSSVFDGPSRRPFSRMLSTKASMPRQLSTLPAELEAAAATAVDMGLTALSIAPDTAEPVLDPYFFASMKAHFNQLAEDQTLRLQSKLNTGLPTILKQFGVKHVNGTVSSGTGRRSGLLPVD